MGVVEWLMLTRPFADYLRVRGREGRGHYRVHRLLEEQQAVGAAHAVVAAEPGGGQGLRCGGRLASMLQRGDMGGNVPVLFMEGWKGNEGKGNSCGGGGRIFVLLLFFSRVTGSCLVFGFRAFNIIPVS